MTAYLVQFLLFPLPWSWRRVLLGRIWGFAIDPSAKIGFSIVKPGALRMGPRSKIGHLNFVRGMGTVSLGADSSIGNLNWIYGIPRSMTGAKRYGSALRLDDGAKVTHRHLIDCTDTVALGRNSLLAGYRTQVLSHSVDVHRSVQQAQPIRIGANSFVGTGCIVLGGANLPANSVLGAGSTLRSAYDEEFRLYSGVPAEAVSSLPEDAGFFRRSEPYVDFER